ncbi:MAG: hypothetical protein ABIH66_10540 [bacterium]
MALIKTVKPEEAEGRIKEVYSMFQNTGSPVPKPMQLMSASPKLFDIFSQVVHYYLNHPTLSMPLLAHIRYLSASLCAYPYCIDFNKNILTGMLGVSEENAMSMMDDPSQATLEDKEVKMLVFVVKAVRTPEDVEPKDVEAVREAGWSDEDIFDAVNHGANMAAGGILFNAFKMGI